jgi:hypothetical protein
VIVSWDLCRNFLSFTCNALEFPLLAVVNNFLSWNALDLPILFAVLNLFEARWKGKNVLSKICLTKPHSGGNRTRSSFLYSREHVPSYQKVPFARTTS